MVTQNVFDLGSLYTNWQLSPIYSRVLRKLTFLAHPTNVTRGLRKLNYKITSFLLKTCSNIYLVSLSQIWDGKKYVSVDLLYRSVCVDFL